MSGEWDGPSGLGLGFLLARRVRVHLCADEVMMR